MREISTCSSILSHLNQKSSSKPTNKDHIFTFFMDSTPSIKKGYDSKNSPLRLRPVTLPKTTCNSINKPLQTSQPSFFQRSTVYSMLVSGRIIFSIIRLSPTKTPRFAVPLTQSKRMHTPRLVATPRPLLPLPAFPHDLVHDPWNPGTTRGAYIQSVCVSHLQRGGCLGEKFSQRGS